jgi:hypothetical protein
MGQFQCRREAEAVGGLTLKGFQTLAQGCNPGFWSDYVMCPKRAQAEPTRLNQDKR